MLRGNGRRFMDEVDGSYSAFQILNSKMLYTADAHTESQLVDH